MLLPAFSLGAALIAPGNLSASERSVEWMRDHGMGGLVNRVEAWWFSNHQAKQGGEPDHPIDIAAPPDQASTTDSSAPPSVATTPRPADLAVPDGVQPLPNEGAWKAVGPSIDGASAMYATQVRPDSVHTSVLDGLVWIDPKLA
ncbi:MAG: hypothetical protein ACXWB2_11590, partial [Acidimicrobiales bacterium]